MFTDHKWLKLAFQIFSALCVVAVGVCLICDLAVNRRLSWALYVLCAVPFLWCMAAPPLVLKKYQVLSTLSVCTLALPLFLLLLERLTPIRGWFTPLGLPIAVVALLAMWATWLLLKFLKTNTWYLSAVLVFLFGVIVNGTVNVIVSLYVNQRLFGISDIISLLACAAITVLLCVIGYGGKKEQQ